MKAAPVYALFAASLALFTLSALRPAAAQTEDRLDAPGLKALLVGLGYEVKDLGSEPIKEKFQLTVTAEGFNIPVAAELSRSRSYLWLTANLGNATSGTKHLEMLKANAKIQPSQFYITEGDYVMMAIALENRSVTSPMLRRGLDKLVKDIASTSKTWGN